MFINSKGSTQTRREERKKKIVSVGRSVKKLGCIGRGSNVRDREENGKREKERRHTKGEPYFSLLLCTCRARPLCARRLGSTTTATKSF